MPQAPHQGRRPDGGQAPAHLDAGAPRHCDRGASDNSGWSRYTYANLLRGGYPHAVHLVNRRGEPVHGQPTVASLRDIGQPVDLAYVLADSAVRALPVTPGEVREMLTRGLACPASRPRAPRPAG